MRQWQEAAQLHAAQTNCLMHVVLVMRSLRLHRAWCRLAAGTAGCFRGHKASWSNCQGRANYSRLKRIWSLWYTVTVRATHVAALTAQVLALRFGQALSNRFFSWSVYSKCCQQTSRTAQHVQRQLEARRLRSILWKWQQDARNIALAQSSLGHLVSIVSYFLDRKHCHRAWRLWQMRTRRSQTEADVGVLHVTTRLWREEMQLMEKNEAYLKRAAIGLAAELQHQQALACSRTTSFIRPEPTHTYTYVNPTASPILRHALLQHGTPSKMQVSPSPSSQAYANYASPEVRAPSLLPQTPTLHGERWSSVPSRARVHHEVHREVDRIVVAFAEECTAAGQ